MLQQSFLQPFNKNQIIVLRIRHYENSIRVNLLLLPIKNDLAPFLLSQALFKRVFFNLLIPAAKDNKELATCGKISVFVAISL
jgi:hypothetical protein